MNTKWINLTNLKNWDKENLSGIQRVLFEIVKVAIQQANIKYFYFQNSPIPAFIELSKEQVQAIINREKGQTSDKLVENDEELFNKFSKLYMLTSKIVPDKILKKLPASFLKIAATILRSPVRFAKKIKSLLFLQNAKSLQFREIEMAKKNTQSPFARNDTICLFGGCWGVANLMEEMTIQKNDKNLTVITLIYDLIPVFQPYLFGIGFQEIFIKYASRALIISDKILAISDSTKKNIEELSKNLSIKTQLIKVVRLGDDGQSIGMHGEQTDQEISRPYILCVGTIEVRKNHLLIYQAYKYLIEKYGMTAKLPDLYIVGGIGWFTDDIRHQVSSDPQINKRMHIITNCSDAELVSLYKNCLFTVYPSMYEGWGLPIAESLHYGKFCLASQTSSMPEIAGDLLEYFSPYDSSQFAELIWAYSTDSGKLKTKEERILREFKPTRWKDSAEGILAECVL